MNNKDRHENANWAFVKAQPDELLPGRFRRLYKSTKNPNLYKRVAQRAGCSSNNMWQGVAYALATVRNEDGTLVWVRSVEEAMDTPRRRAEHNWIVKYNAASDAGRAEMERGEIPEGLRHIYGRAVAA